MKVCEQWSAKRWLVEQLAIRDARRSAEVNKAIRRAMKRAGIW
jgi:hypothetical protein